MITKKMLRDWIGDDNMDTNSLLELVLDLVNGDYPIELCKNEIIWYTEDEPFFEEPETYDEFGVNTTNSFNTPPKEQA